SPHPRYNAGSLSHAAGDVSHSRTSLSESAMVFKVFVDGQEGTTGLRLLDYLSGRSDVELLRIADDKRKDPAERARFLNAADVAFLCLPDAASREAVSLVTNPNTCVIDAST